ncbi:hypothetical protein GUI12_02480 [Anaplasmataceae bacterium AB001_6]|nr:hypothetical protein GUI12_02480 [Anaplasmataceae bacterium AB001_6]
MKRISIIFSVFLLTINNIEAAIVQKKSNIYSEIFYQYSIMNDISVSIKDSKYKDKIIYDTAVTKQSIDESLLGFGFEVGYESGDMFSFGIIFDHREHGCFTNNINSNNKDSSSEGISGFFNNDNTSSSNGNDETTKTRGYKLTSTKLIEHTPADEDTDTPQKDVFRDKNSYIDSISKNFIGLVSDVNFHIREHKLTPSLGLGLGVNRTAVTYNTIDFYTNNSSNFTTVTAWPLALLARAGISYDFSENSYIFTRIAINYTTEKNLSGNVFVDEFERVIEDNELKSNTPKGTINNQKSAFYGDFSYQFQLGIGFMF